jgi:hypothetical protein
MAHAMRACLLASATAVLFQDIRALPKFRPTSAAMDHQDGLLLEALDGHEGHARAASSLTHCGRIISVVLADTSLLAIGRDETGVDDARIVAQSAQLTRPMVNT